MIVIDWCLLEKVCFEICFGKWKINWGIYFPRIFCTKIDEKMWTGQAFGDEIKQVSFRLHF